MPFVRINNPDGFIWRLREGEVVTLPEILNSRMLIITTDIADPCYRLKVPSLDAFNATGTLEHLEIWDLNVIDMPAIPDSVRSLQIRNTNMTNLNQIHANWRNMDNLTLDSNKKLKGSLIVPDGVQEFVMGNQLVDIIRFPSEIKRVQCGPRVRFTQLVGSLPSETLFLFNVFAHPYKKVLSDMEEQCQNEIRHSLAMYEDMITQKWHMRQMKYIEEVNTNLRYKTYEEIGSIAARIRVSEDNIENPIVVAMKLASNYPRRMAEFLSY
jgi:hypothetical protein